MDYEQQIQALQARCDRLEDAFTHAILWAVVMPTSPWNSMDARKLIGILKGD